jgi:hypothetical protein
MKRIPLLPCQHRFLVWIPVVDAWAATIIDHRSLYRCLEFRWLLSLLTQSGRETEKTCWEKTIRLGDSEVGDGSIVVAIDAPARNYTLMVPAPEGFVSTWKWWKTKELSAPSEKTASRRFSFRDDQ